MNVQIHPNPLHMNVINTPNATPWSLLWDATAGLDTSLLTYCLMRCLTFVVHGIGQYHRAQQGVNSQFFKKSSEMCSAFRVEEVSKVRKLSMKYQLERAQAEAGDPRPYAPFA